MNVCPYCRRIQCKAYATVQRGGVEFPALDGDDRFLAEVVCRENTRERADRLECWLERANKRIAELEKEVKQ